MPRVEVALVVHVGGALSVGGQTAAGAAAARQLARDAHGRFILPGSQVKGRLRYACAQVAQTLGLPACPRGAMAAEQAASGARCVLCTLFGAPGRAAALRWVDLPCVETIDSAGAQEEAGAGALVAPTSRVFAPVDRRRGTQLAESVQWREATPLLRRGWRFAHERAISGELSDLADLHLLLAGCRLVQAFGGGHSRGLGWSTVAATARVDGEPFAFDAAALAGRPAATAAWESGSASRPGDPSAAAGVDEC